MALLLLSAPALAAGRGDRIAMAVALLDVVEEHCSAAVSIDEDLREHLMLHFHEYDIGGLASAISRPLNAYYEDFLHAASRDAKAFCARAPRYAEITGYPVVMPRP